MEKTSFLRTNYEHLPPLFTTQQQQTSLKLFILNFKRFLDKSGVLYRLEQKNGSEGHLRAFFDTHQRLSVVIILKLIKRSEISI